MTWHFKRQLLNQKLRVRSGLELLFLSNRSLGVLCRLFVL
jgi:hypothetical protein